MKKSWVEKLPGKVTRFAVASGITYQLIEGPYQNFVEGSGEVSPEEE
jgi:hypothetical protein